VYDVLNVFSALNIVKKYKNKIMISAEGAKKLKEGNQVWQELEAIEEKPADSPSKPDFTARIEKLKVTIFIGSWFVYQIMLLFNFIFLMVHIANNIL